MITRKKRRRRHVTRIRVFVNIHIFIYVFGMSIDIFVCGLQENKRQMLKSFYFLPYILNAVFSILSKTLILSSAIYFSPCFSRKWKSTSTHISSDCRFASILKKKKSQLICHKTFIIHCQRLNIFLNTCYSLNLKYKLEG